MASTLKSFSTIAIISLVSYPLSFVNQILYSKYFGTSAGLDSVFVAQTCITLLFFYVGPFKDVFLPQAFHLQAVNNEAGSRYYSGFFNFLIIILSIGMLLALFFPGLVVQVVVGKANIWLRESTVKYVQILSPLILISAIAGVFGVALSSYNKVIYQNLGRLVGTTTSIVVLFFLAKKLRVEAVIISGITTEVILFTVQALEFRKLPLKYHWNTTPLIDPISLRRAAGMLGAYALGQVYLIYERSVFASFGPGIISAYQYGKTLYSIPESIIITAAVSALWPKLLEYSKCDTRNQLAAFVSESSKNIIIVLSILSSILFFNAKPIVYFFYFRGAFNWESLEKTTLAVHCVSLALVPLGFYGIIARVFLSLQNIKIAMTIGIISTLFGIGTLFLAKEVHVVGIAYSHFLAMAMGGATTSLIGYLFFIKKPSFAWCKETATWAIKVFGFAGLVGYGISAISVMPYGKGLLALYLTGKGLGTSATLIFLYYASGIISRKQIVQGIAMMRKSKSKISNIWNR